LIVPRYDWVMNPDKPAGAHNVPTPTERPRRQILHEEIARRAKQLWQERGEPSGSDESIWLEAESQLQAEAESRPVAGTESRPYADEPAKPVRSQSKSRDPSEAGAQTRSATDSKSKQSAGKIRNQ
jgi:hypothetical protein